jgi:hypothetical protein
MPRDRIQQQEPEEDGDRAKEAGSKPASVASRISEW